MKKNIFKIGLVSSLMVINLHAEHWLNCAVDVCSNMGISSS